jgi:hypothetical protein
VSSRGTDFFISHAGRDTGWAEWLAWQLQQAGYTVELDVWDWAPGEDFVARMAAALESADRLLAVCTEAYFSSAFGGAELRAAFAGQARAEGRIVPVLVEPVTLPPLYAPLIRVDLAGLDEHRADREADCEIGLHLARIVQRGRSPPRPERVGQGTDQADGLRGLHQQYRAGVRPVPASHPEARRVLPLEPAQAHPLPVMPVL